MTFVSSEHFHPLKCYSSLCSLAAPMPFREQPVCCASFSWGNSSRIASLVLLCISECDSSIVLIVSAYSGEYGCLSVIICMVLYRKMLKTWNHFSLFIAIHRQKSLAISMCPAQTGSFLKYRAIPQKKNMIIIYQSELKSTKSIYINSSVLVIFITSFFQRPHWHKSFLSTWRTLFCQYKV